MARAAKKQRNKPKRGSEPEQTATPEQAQAAYAAGLEARDRGAYEEAANQFYRAYKSLPAEPRERRAAVLFDLVAARRSAYEEQGDAAQLCASRRVLDVYIEERAAEDEVHRDTKKARELRAMVHADVELLTEMDPALDCVALRVEGEPPATEVERAVSGAVSPKGSVNGERLVLAGAVTTGVGALLLGATIAGVVVFARANGAQQELIDQGATITSSNLEELTSRQRVGVGVAVNGGLLAGAALGAGITMLVIGSRARLRRPVSFAPLLTRGAGGAAFGMRF